MQKQKLKNSDQDLDKFFNKVDGYMVKKTKKSQNGRNKSDYEMKCYWITPKGGKFTYRGDDNFKRLKEVNKITAASELRGLQIQFSIVRKRLLAAIIYDNTVPYGENNTLFHFDKGEILVNKLEWKI
jgi:hypothetical protein